MKEVALGSDQVLRPCVELTVGATRPVPTDIEGSGQDQMSTIPGTLRREVEWAYVSTHPSSV